MQIGDSWLNDCNTDLSGDSRVSWWCQAIEIGLIKFGNDTSQQSVMDAGNSVCTARKSEWSRNNKIIYVIIAQYFIVPEHSIETTFSISKLLSPRFHLDGIHLHNLRQSVNDFTSAPQSRSAFPIADYDQNCGATNWCAAINALN